MNKMWKKRVSMILSAAMVTSIQLPVMAQTSDEVKLTILGTSDIHGNLTSWSYENNHDYENAGLARIATLVKEVRAENPNTLVIDNGDTIQGTILTDDLYNADMTLDNPVMDMMNYIGYDAMTLGNHEFNFGTDLILKIQEEANFPLLAANIYHTGTDDTFVDPYVIKEVDGVKVGILGLTVPSIPRWDANKQGVKDLDYRHMANEAEKYVDILENVEEVDVIIATAHAGLESRHETDGGDAAKLILERCPEIDALLVGHDHVTINEEINGVLVGAPYVSREVVRFDFNLVEEDGEWTVESKSTNILKVADYEEDAGAAKVAKPYHEHTMGFLEGSIGTATADFHPAPEVAGIPEAQIRDTALIDLINQVQLDVTGADVASAALFSSTSNLPEGELSFADVFDIYKYANTLIGVEVTGAELKDFMEWSASYYNTYKPGDLTVSFNQSVRGYAYDMFQGVDYTIDISEEPGNRIKDVMFKGEPLADDTVLKLAVNDYRYSGIGPDGSGLVSGEPYFESAPKALRTYIKEYIEEKGTIEPVVDNNWQIVGNDWNEELRAIAVEAVNNGTLTVPKSADGRTDNVKAITESDLIEVGLHPEYTDHMAIVHINDSHGKIVEGSYDGMGMPKVAGYIENLEAIYGEEDILVLDAGDTLHGMPIISIDKGEGMINLLEVMGIDAMVAGNHDFNYGYERLIELNELSEFPILAANITKDNEAILDDYIIKEVEGKKVGIFGLGTPSTTVKTHPNNVEGLAFEDPIEWAEEMVKELEKQEVDMIIALAHLGLDQDSLPTSKEVAEAVDGIDLIVDGHSHTELPEGLVVNDTMIVQAGEHTKNIGHVNVFFKEDGSMTIVPFHLTKAESSSIVESEEVVAVIEALNTTFTELTSEVVATIDTFLEGDREVVRKQESNLGNLVTNAILDLTGADIALTNGGGMRVSVESGEVTKGDIIAVLPFGNTTVMIEATGEEVLEALEHSVSKYPETNGAFAHVAGMTYTFDPSQPAGSRITEVLVSGEALDLDKVYTVGTNDFLAAGGDAYTMFAGNKVVGEFQTLDEAVIKYLQEKGLENTEVQNRINVIEVEVEEVPETEEVVEMVEIQPAA